MAISEVPQTVDGMLIYRMIRRPLANVPSSLYEARKTGPEKTPQDRLFSKDEAQHTALIDREDLDFSQRTEVVARLKAAEANSTTAEAEPMRVMLAEYQKPEAGLLDATNYILHTIADEIPKDMNPTRWEVIRERREKLRLELSLTNQVDGKTFIDPTSLEKHGVFSHIIRMQRGGDPRVNRWYERFTPKLPTI